MQAFTIVSKTPFGLNFNRNDDTSDMIKPLAIAQRWPVRTWNSLKERALHQAEKLAKFAHDSEKAWVSNIQPDMMSEEAAVCIYLRSLPGI